MTSLRRRWGNQTSIANFLNYCNLSPTECSHPLHPKDGVDVSLTHKTILHSVEVLRLRCVGQLLNTAIVANTSISKFKLGCGGLLVDRSVGRGSSCCGRQRHPPPPLNLRLVPAHPHSRNRARRKVHIEFSGNIHPSAATAEESYPRLAISGRP